MSEIKWIKITTDMFDDEKITFVESLPEADAILVIWIKLLTLAGKSNMRGHIFLTENIPYSDEMLAHKFRRPINIVRLALKTFQRLGMVELDDLGFTIANWEKHQNIQGMEHVRQLERERKRKQREKQKMLPPAQDVTGQSRDSHADVTQQDLELDLDIENTFYVENTEKIPFAEIISYLNEKTGRKFRNVAANQKLIKARWNEGYRLDDFKAVIDKKAGHWKSDPEMDYHLKPETLFGSKFDKYMNEPLQNPFKKRQAYQTPQPSPQNVAPPDIDPEVLQRIKNLSGVKTNGS